MGNDVKRLAKQFHSELVKHECSDFEVEMVLGMMLERLANKENIEIEIFDSMFSKNHKYVIVHFRDAGIVYLLYVNFNVYDIDMCFVFRP